MFKLGDLVRLGKFNDSNVWYTGKIGIVLIYRSSGYAKVFVANYGSLAVQGRSLKKDLTTNHKRLIIFIDGERNA